MNLAHMTTRADFLAAARDIRKVAGAVTLAALLAGKFDARGKIVGAVISGGNIDPATFQRALA